MGQYQHDLTPAQLAERLLGAVVEDAVNAVGVDLNTASPALLARVAGVGPLLSENIVAHRNEHGPFGRRHELLKAARLGPKAFEQCAGFLRITGGTEPLDGSSVHPEAYAVARRILAAVGAGAATIAGGVGAVAGVNPHDFVDDTFGLPTIKDIVAERPDDAADRRRPARGAADRRAALARRPGAQARGAGDRRRLRRPDGRPRAAAQPQPRLDRDRLRRRRPAQAGDADARGLKVLGLDRARSPTILDETEPDEVVIAIPSAPGTLRAKVVAACREREIRVRTLPTVFELLRGGVQLNKQLREVQVEDVLGRDPIVVELDRVGAYLRDRIVLVTGAGGSIGSELCRQIARVEPRLLVMLDHAEDNLFEIDREMVEERHFTNVESVLADCKEPHRMLEMMQRFKPERRLPRRRLQARAADGGQPAGGGPQQRDRDPDHGRDRRRLEGRALRPDLDRQGGQPDRR